MACLAFTPLELGVGTGTETLLPVLSNQILYSTQLNWVPSFELASLEFGKSRTIAPYGVLTLLSVFIIVIWSLHRYMEAFAEEHVKGDPAESLRGVL
jgi:ABC-type dipeptide/oligopeptide/nickel transport system permease component